MAEASHFQIGAVARFLDAAPAKLAAKTPVDQSLGRRLASFDVAVLQGNAAEELIKVLDAQDSKGGPKAEGGEAESQA